MRLLLSLLIASACLVWSVACRTSEQPNHTTSVASGGFPRTLRDGSGAEITIKTKSVRIVSQTLSTDEILWEICPRERLAGVSKIGLEPKYSPIAAALQAARIKPISNAEEILQLQPDLVFVASFSRAETVESLRAAGAVIFRFANFDTLADIQQNIRLVGQAIGEEANAEKLIARMNDELAAINRRIPAGGTPPRVLSYSLSGNSAGADTSFDAIVRAAGAVNVAAEQGLRGFPKISPEQVVQWQPDFLVLGAEEANLASAKTRMLEHPVIATTNAARAKRIVVLDTRYLLAVSHHITRAISDLADALYGAEAKSQAKPGAQ